MAFHKSSHVAAVSNCSRVYSGSRRSFLCRSRVARAQSGNSSRLVHPLGITHEVEGQFPANQQFFQKFIGHDLVFPSMLADRQGHLQRRKYSLRADMGLGRRWRGPMVRSSRRHSGETVGKKLMEIALRLFAAAAKEGRGPYAVVDLARLHQFGNILGSVGGFGKPPSNPDMVHRLEILREEFVNLGTQRIGRIGALLNAACGHDQLESTAKVWTSNSGRGPDNASG